MHEDRMTKHAILGYIKGMETEPVELPTALLKAAGLDRSHVSEDAARLIAVELFREDKVSLGRAAELCRERRR